MTCVGLDPKPVSSEDCWFDSTRILDQHGIDRSLISVGKK